jgi:hypothetical protein
MRAIVCVIAIALGAASSAAHHGSQDKSTAKQFVGIWSGSWEGAGSSGGFELTFEEGKEGAVTGQVAVTGEPTYTTKIRTLSFEGSKMAATYDFPPDESAEVILAAAFDGTSANGTWLLRAKSGGTEVASGTWTVKRK